MNFAIPRNNSSKMLCYIWKVIDIPSISQNDFVYKISFVLYILPPMKAINFINECIENGLLFKDDNENLKLSNPLNKKIKNWHKQRKNEILQNLNNYKKIVKLQTEFDKDNSDNYKLLLRAFTDRSTLNRAVAVSNSSFELINFSSSQGTIKSKVLGSKEEVYIIDIDTNDKILRHDCHDFKTRKAENKKFCKHLAKLFLFLKDKDAASAEFFLSELAENIDNWEFNS